MRVTWNDLLLPGDAPAFSGCDPLPPFDADTLPVPAFGGTARVHKGFKRALNSIWTPLATVLDPLDAEKAAGVRRCPVFYTGRRLGAALATLAAARRAPQAVYAYGSPRVGERAFALPKLDVRAMWSQLTSPVGPLADHAPMRYFSYCAADLTK